ncbi:MAG TPA: J domain-containing protein [Nitrolancea sp.]|nr:J domain-containing protein [Nitrolancea sp.]
MAGGRPPKFDPTINYYQVLNVPPTATKAEITQAYRELIRHTHPDRVSDEAERKKAEERCKLLNAAHMVLTKPDLRREYDLSIRQTAVSDALFQRYTGNGASQPSPYASRSTRISPHMSRAQKRANRSAFFQLLLATFIFAVIIIVVIVVGSLVAGGIHAFFP